VRPIDKVRVKCRIEIVQLLKERYDQKKFCVFCGREIERQGELTEIWNKKRKCIDCSDSKKLNNNFKFCSQCGNKEFKAENRTSKSWNSFTVCEKCKPNNLFKRNSLNELAAKFIGEINKDLLLISESSAIKIEEDVYLQIANSLESYLSSKEGREVNLKHQLFLEKIEEFFKDTQIYF
jgi:hypothetical protein